MIFSWTGVFLHTLWRCEPEVLTFLVTSRLRRINYLWLSAALSFPSVRLLLLQFLLCFLLALNFWPVSYSNVFSPIRFLLELEGCPLAETARHPKGSFHLDSPINDRTSDPLHFSKQLCPPNLGFLDV